MKHFNKAWLFLLALPLGGMAQDLKPDAKIPFDAAVRTGKLKNGLTYYIRKNAKPENKVDLRLVVNAGSLQETDEQQGLAHFMEHMNFNGTKRFPKNALVDYLQSIGVKFGQHLNAYTSFDETVYFLPIPSDSPEKLEKGFQILEDWAFNANLTPEEIDKERGVVLEEYRLGLGADKRMEDRYLPKMLYKSRHADRLPIGKKEVLQNFTYDKIVNFHKDWYRPDLMSVIVVGDIDVDAMEKKIRDHFSAYANPKSPKKRENYSLPNHKETFVCIESDKEASGTQVQVLYKDYDTKKPTVTVADYRNDMIEGLYSSLLNNRLRELTNSPTPPFTFGFTYHGGTYARDKEAYQSFAMMEEDKVLSALRTLSVENARAKKHGFTQSELDRAKADVLARYERQYKDRDKSESDNFVNEYQMHFLSQEPTPGIAWEYKAVQELLPGITLAEVNAVPKDYVKEDNRVIIITGPEKEGGKKITEAEVLAAITVSDADVKPYEDKAVAESLLRRKVNPGSVTARENDAKIGTTTLTLSNGAKVTYKKTDFKNDEVLMEAVSFGGSNLYSDEESKRTQFANGGLTEAGFSGLSRNDINKFMSGKIANVSPYIGGVTEGFRGSSTPKDMEYMFQVLHAYFTDLNLDKEAFNGYKSKQSAFYENLSSEPSVYFQKELYGYLNTGNPRFTGIIPDQKAWEATDYELAYKKYQERFADAGDFHFYFVGNIDEKALEEYAVRYIASLPSKGIKEQPKDLGFRWPKGDVKKVVKKGEDPKSTVNIMFYGDAAYTPKEAYAMEALGEVLTIKLVEELRENESGVYGVGARGSMSKVPYGYFNFSINFPCGPENAEKLTASALRELQKIIDNGPDEKDLVKFREAELLEYKKDLKENRYWLTNFSRSYVNRTSPAEVLEMEKKINSVTAADIQSVARKYLTKDKVVAMLMPEKS